MMKKCIMLLASAMMVLSLAACTPTPEKENGNEAMATMPTQETVKADTMELRNSGNENLPEMMTVSIYRINKDNTGLIQEMDGLETEELDAQGIVDLMVEYEVLEEGTEVVSFEESDGKATLNLSQITSSDDEAKIRAVVESIVNTFTENYELEGGLILQENGEVYTVDAAMPEEDGTMYYNDAYRKFE
ncbi:MAG: GerMN domain-containing protein [Lachnospiraceae bacterium]|nr:GerMN domain-containing protein [Lachnospiraceae bacterium]